MISKKESTQPLSDEPANNNLHIYVSASQTWGVGWGEARRETMKWGWAKCVFF